MNASKILMKALLFAVLAGSGMGAGAITIVTDPVSPVDIVAQGYNGHDDYKSWRISTATHALAFTSDATVTLAASAAVDGVFSLYCNIFATNCTITVEAETGISKIRWIGGIECDKVIVKGASAIEFGDTVTSSLKTGKSCLSYFGAGEVEFEAADPTFTFVNAVTLAKAPTCAYTIASGTLVATAAENILGSGGTFTVQDYDISLIETKGINADKIAVKSGRFFTVFPCMKVAFGNSQSADYNRGRWAWAGESSQTVAYDFELEYGSTLNVYGSQVDQTFAGKLTGTTALEIVYNATKLPGNLNFTGEVNLAGTVTLDNCSSIHCKGDGPFAFGDLTCADYATKGNTFTFAKPANGSIGSLTGGIKVVGDADSTFTVGALAAGAVLDVDGTVKVSFTTDADATATVNLLGADGGWTLSGPAKTAVTVTNLVPATEGLVINLDGRLSLGDLGAKFGTINLMEGAELSGTTFAAATKVTGKGRVIYTGSSWKDKIYFWADGSKADSMVPVREAYPGYISTRKPVAKISGSTTEYDIVYDWKDCRGDGMPYMIRSWRCTSQEDYNSINAVPTYPFFASNVYVSAEAKLPGYMSFAGASASSRNAVLCKYDETLEEKWSYKTAVETAYAIVVFGSQQGGGAGILGTTDGSFARTYSKTQADASNPMFTVKNYEVYADGTKVADSTVTGFNGGWQILSVNTENSQVHGLGFDKLTSGNRYAPSGSNRGYGNYAEIMLFSETPTEMERKVIEEQLAAKWGLPCSHSGTVSEVALNVEVGGEPSASALVTYPEDDIPRAFTVNVNLPSNFKRGVEYPILACSDTDTVALGTVTGRSMDVRIVRRDGVAHLLAPRSGLMCIVR